MEFMLTSRKYSFHNNYMRATICPIPREKPPSTDGDDRLKFNLKFLLTKLIICGMILFVSHKNAWSLRKYVQSIQCTAR